MSDDDIPDLAYSSGSDDDSVSGEPGSNCM